MFDPFSHFLINKHPRILAILSVLFVINVPTNILELNGVIRNSYIELNDSILIFSINLKPISFIAILYKDKRYFKCPSLFIDEKYESILYPLIY